MDHNRRSFVYFYPNQIVTEYVSISMGFLFIFYNFLFIITLREHLILFILLNLDSKWIQEGEQQLLFKINFYFQTNKTYNLLPCGIRSSILQ